MISHSQWGDVAKEGNLHRYFVIEATRTAICLDDFLRL